eukprot:JP438306.1.p6 GENE.JP438306.1~~JP438306.1.p6  ORF type:complete len:59 (+),score=4.80 JP438306.1:106-282(+)
MCTHHTSQLCGTWTKQHIRTPAHIALPPHKTLDSPHRALGHTSPPTHHAHADAKHNAR